MAGRDSSARQPSSEARAPDDGGPCSVAESAARGRVAASKASHGDTSLQTATAEDALVEALVNNGKANQPSTRELAQRVIQAKETLVGPNAVALAPSLRNLARVSVLTGELQQAILFLRRAVSLLDRGRDAGDITVAESLDDLAYALISSQRYEEAKRELERALSVKETTLGPSHGTVARTLELLGLSLQKQGNYPSARPLLERAIAIRRSLGQERTDSAETLYLYGDQLWFEGDFAGARESYLSAVEVAETSCGQGHPRLSVYLRNAGAAMAALGDLNGAVDAAERALRVAEANLGVDHPEVAMILNGLAIRKKNLGRYAEARNIYERGMRIATQRFGDSHDLVATFSHNLALLNAEIGDVAEAKRQEDQAVAIWERLLGRGHPFVATALDSLAEVLGEQGRDAEARVLFERALAIREQTLKPGHHDLAITQMNLARTLFRLGRVTRAADLSTRALASLENQNTQDNLELARATLIRADLELSSGDYDSARRHYERGLAMRERILGRSNPAVAEARYDLGKVLALTGDRSGAFEQALEAEEIGRSHVNVTLRYLPERQSLSYAAKRPRSLDLALSLTGVDAEPRTRVFDALIRGRALVLDEMATRRRVGPEESREDVAPLRAVLAASQQRLANLVVRGPGAGRPEQFTALVDAARREKELAERALADKSAAFRDEIARGEIGLDDVRRALPAGSALVAFARYDRTPVVASGAPAPQATSTSIASALRPAALVPSYIAFIIREDQPQIALVPIGAAAGVDTLVSRWHADMLNIVGADSPGEVEKAYRVTGAALRRRVWDPVAGYLKDVSTVFVVPDGTLNLLSLVALPVGRTGYLIDQGPVIQYLSAERDLVTSLPAAPSSRGLLAVGGAAFDDATLFTGKASKQRPVTRAPAGVAVAGGLRASCGDLGSLTFDPLAGTLQEVREVARLWSDSPADVLESRGASERAFKQAAPGHRVLHLATHGFFLGSTCRPAIGGTRAVGGLAPKLPSQANRGLADNPLLLSGLALAGANRRAAAASGEDDGILTAEEVAALNLGGVEWAVLSACDTGLGEVKAGEGVFGLRRAFQIAGARTVIMSLWSVDDDATRLWMRTLYEGRLQKHLSTADAIHQANLSMLRARRARGESTHPFYWAGFVAAGDWR
jgi:CHAT domain-containing protein/tetratricopeptide (TPR) repeat protein